MLGEITLALALLLSAPASAEISTHSSNGQWIPEFGDHVLIDTNQNMGYLYHENGKYISFRVVTGQKRNVYYIGRYYNAKTPDKEWEVKSKDIKGDRITFGPTGRFFRLYDDGENTPYGIHGHRDADAMLADDMRYRSMGCIIVSENILDILEKTYEINEGIMKVNTVSVLKMIDN